MARRKILLPNWNVSNEIASNKEMLNAKFSAFTQGEVVINTNSGHTSMVTLDENGVPVIFESIEMINNRFKSFLDASHTHDNKDILDNITSVDIKTWNESLQDAITYTDHKIEFLVSGASEAFDTFQEVEKWISGHSGETINLIADINKLYSSAHTHENKDVLDGITAEKVAAWDIAEANASAYTNQRITSIVDGATADFNTLKKIEVWINGHSGVTNNIIKDINDLSGASHIHVNKEVLDGINEERVQIWDDSKQDAISSAKTYIDDQLKLVNSGAVITNSAVTEIENWIIEHSGVTENILEDIAKLYSSAHTHSNKDLLDTYTQTENDLKDAVTKKHTHDNKGVLDGITAEKIAAWDAAEANASAYTDQQIRFIVSGAPETFDTFQEIYEWIIGHSGETINLIKDISALSTSAHSHDNKDVLDGITAEKVAAWDTAESNVQSDWNTTNEEADSFIKNKPTLSTVATSGSYNDLSDKPSLFSGSYNDLTNTPSFATVATSGKYSDLSGLPTIPSVDGFIKSISLSSSNNTVYLVGSTSKTGTTTSLTTSSTDVYMSNGNLYAASDERLKDFGDNVEVDFDKLSEIPKVYYSWKDDEEKRRMIGTSAQKLKEICPELVSENENGKMAVSYERLSIIALAAVDKLHKENEELKDRLKRIEEKLGL